MSNQFSWWHQVGPSHFIEDIVNSIGRFPIVSIVAPPRTPGGLSAQITERLDSTLFYEVVHIDVDGSYKAFDLFATLSSALNIGSSARTLKNIIDLADRKVLIVEGNDLARQWPAIFKQLPDWIHAFKSGEGYDKPTLLLLTPESLTNDHGLEVLGNKDARLHKYLGRVERIDMLAYIHSVAKFPDFIVPRFFETWITEFCGWDGELALHLAEWDWADLISPWEPMSKLATTLPSITASWSGGGLASFLGSDLVSPLFFAQVGDRTGFDMCVWRAQASQLFPWLEYRRLDLCEHINSTLMWPVIDKDQVKIDRAEEAELGNLCHHYRRCQGGNSKVRDFLENAKSARNHLAHREPISPELLKTLNNSWRGVPNHITSS